MRAVIFIAVAICLPSAAMAHGGENHGLAARWTLDAWIVVPLLASASLYLTGTLVLWRRAGFGRRIRLRTSCAYVAGWVALAGALVSPLHWLGEHFFTFHMIEHEIIMAVSAPLLVLARPVAAFMWALPGSARLWIGHIMRRKLSQSVWIWLTRAGNATVMHGIVIWAWHAPAMFDAAVRNEAVHRLQHLSFFLTALLFWWSIMWRAGYGAACWHVFVTMIHTGILGALMALSPRVLYVAQTAHALAWGLTPLEDQQLAGIVMWVPASTVYAAALIAFAALWISRSRTVAFEWS
jgi:putative membrane protein